MSKIHVTTTINGDETEFLCEPEETLLDVLRETLHLTGSKEGCASGDCGACSVMVDDRLVCSCLVIVTPYVIIHGLKYNSTHMEKTAAANRRQCGHGH